MATSGDDLINDSSSSTFIDALAGADTVYGNGGNDTLFGNSGNDFLFGGAGTDSLNGGANNDSLYGGGDNDVLYDDSGVNLYDGGDGNDAITATSSSGGTILGGAGNDFIYGGTSSFSSNYLIYGDDGASGTGNDNILGNNGADTIYGESGSDTLQGADNSDYLSGGDGGDSLDGGASTDTLLGGDGNDVLIGGDHTDSLVGGLGADTLIGGMENDSLEGGGGDDVYVFTSDITASQAIITDTSGSNLIRFNNDSYSGTAYINTTYPSGDVYMLPLLGDMSKRMTIGYDSSGDYAVMSVYYPIDFIESWHISDWSISDFGITLGNGIWFEDTTGTNDSVTGTAYADIILAGGGHDTVFGYGGGDTIDGGSGNDFLYGVDDADSIKGGSGNDEIHGNDGSDTLDGGADFDTVSFYNSSAVSINLTTGTHSGGYATGDVLSNFEAFILTVNGDTLVGDSNHNLIFALGGADSISTGDGNDSMYGDAGADTINGGNGGDWMFFTDSAAISINLVTGTHTGTDTSGDVYQSLEFFSLSQNADSFVGDTSTLGIYGLGGNDTIQAGGGSSEIADGEGADSVMAEGGDDSIGASLGADTVDGGLGLDRIDYSGSNAAIVLNLLTNTNTGGHAAGDILSNIEYFIGSDYNDQMIGDTSANQLQGGAGSDTIIGGVGDDRLFGDGGADKFTYQFLSDSTDTVYDTISDFLQSDGDKLDFTAFGASLSFSTTGYTGTAKEMAFFHPGGGYSYVGYDADGDADTDFKIAFDDIITFTAGDFIFA